MNFQWFENLMIKLRYWMMVKQFLNLILFTMLWFLVINFQSNHLWDFNAWLTSKCIRKQNSVPMINSFLITVSLEYRIYWHKDSFKTKLKEVQRLLYYLNYIVEWNILIIFFIVLIFFECFDSFDNFYLKMIKVHGLRLFMPLKLRF